MSKDCPIVRILGPPAQFKKWHSATVRKDVSSWWVRTLIRIPLPALSKVTKTPPSVILDGGSLYPWHRWSSPRGGRRLPSRPSTTPGCPCRISCFSTCNSTSFSSFPPLTVHTILRSTTFHLAASPRFHQVHNSNSDDCLCCLERTVQDLDPNPPNPPRSSAEDWLEKETLWYYGRIWGITLPTEYSQSVSQSGAIAKDRTRSPESKHNLEQKRSTPLRNRVTASPPLLCLPSYSVENWTGLWWTSQAILQYHQDDNAHALPRVNTAAMVMLSKQFSRSSLQVAPLAHHVALV